MAATLDQRTRIGLIGDVSAYAALQAADAIRDSARNTGAGGAGAAVGVGIAMAGQLAHAATAVMQPTVAMPAAVRSAPSAVASPPPIPKVHAFYLAVDGQPQGPFDVAALGARVADGRLTRDTLVWGEGMVLWAPAGQVAALAALLGAG